MNRNNKCAFSKYYFLLMVLVTITLFSSCKQSKSKKITKNEFQNKAHKIDSLVGLFSDYDGFNGAVLVSHEGGIIYKKGFGFANLEWDIPNQIDTKFRIASITKPFTAMLIMQLVADGKLELHVPISTYLSDYPKENGDQITIHHLLTHSSGIKRDYDDDLPKNKYPDRYSPKQSVELFSGLPLEFKPGKQFDYSNAGYIVLSYIIETVTEKRYETVLQEQILDPLQMKNTGIDKHRTLIKNRAYGYFKGFGDYFNQDFGDMSAITGVGNIYSTVEDMFLLDQALYTEKLLPKKYMDLLFTKHILDPGYGGYYGFGWELKEKPIGNTSKTIETIGHSGSMQGFTALFTRIPSSNSSIVFFNNTGRAFLNAMTTAITGILNDEPYDFPRESLAFSLFKVVEKDGIEKGIEFYTNNKNNDHYILIEDEINEISYKLLQINKTEEAAEVIKLGLSSLPKAFNLHDSHGEILLILGDTIEAIKKYKKSIELNPNNTHGIQVLKKLGLDVID